MYNNNSATVNGNRFSDVHGSIALFCTRSLEHQACLFGYCGLRRSPLMLTSRFGCRCRASSSTQREAASHLHTLTVGELTVTSR